MSSCLALPALQDLEGRLVSFARQRGYRDLPSKLVTDVGSDKSTRFVGSVTTIFKPHYGILDLDSSGYFVIQDCLKTNNLARADVRRPSLYPAFGTNVIVDDLNRAISDLYGLLIEIFGVPRSFISTSVSSLDTDLRRSCARAATDWATGSVLIDTLPLERYRHRFGEDRHEGKNCVVFLDDGLGAHRRQFVATGVIVSLDGRDAYVETTIKPLSVLAYLSGSGSEFDIYPPVRGVADLPAQVRRIVHDGLIVSAVLLYSGLLPTNRSNQTRLFRKYITRLVRLVPDTEPHTDIVRLIDNYSHEIVERAVPTEALATLDALARSLRLHEDRARIREKASQSVFAPNVKNVP